MQTRRTQLRGIAQQQSTTQQPPAQAKGSRRRACQNARGPCPGRSRSRRRPQACATVPPHHHCRPSSILTWMRSAESVMALPSRSHIAYSRSLNNGDDQTRPPETRTPPTGSKPGNVLIAILPWIFQTGRLWTPELRLRGPRPYSVANSYLWQRQTQRTQRHAIRPRKPALPTDSRLYLPWEHYTSTGWCDDYAARDGLASPLRAGFGASACTLAQVSRRPTVRLKIGWVGVLSRSRQK